MKIFNTLTKQIEPLVTLEPKKIKLYVCGMTVYDYCHIGHARVMVVFDVVARYLRSLGYDVVYVRNITDIDDKIIQRAQHNQEHISELTQRYIQAMHEDAQQLNVLSPTIEPCATAYIEKMIALIQILIEKKVAYVANNGDVYYAVNQFPKYGELAHQDLENLRVGARVSLVEAKTDPLDFVLWKLAKPQEPAWDSPWGAGRPGWHIECSAMALDCLGEQFDIHGGGFDLIFPHHQNEVAQSEAVTEKRFANTWMHVGFVNVNKEKMSKSLGNFFTIREVLQQYPAEVVRYFLLSSHYRSALNFSHEALDNARAALERFYLALRGLDIETIQDDTDDNHFIEKFHTVMKDDFNTAEALAVLFELAREINRLHLEDVPKALGYAKQLKTLGNLLGILQQDPEEFLRSNVDAALLEKIQSLINERNLARQQKDWATADKIRQQLQAMQIAIEDNANGTLWRKA